VDQGCKWEKGIDNESGMSSETQSALNQRQTQKVAVSRRKKMREENRETDSGTEEERDTTVNYGVLWRENEKIRQEIYPGELGQGLAVEMRHGEMSHMDGPVSRRS
jgi:hypothetical protein